MWKTFASVAAIAAAMTMTATPASADRGSHSQRASLPTCSQPIGAISIVEPDDNWWQRYDLDSPEAVINLLVLRSGCFTIVDRGRGLRSRNLERALADNGDRCAALGARTFPLHHDHLALAGTTLPDGKQRAHAKPPHCGFVQDLDLHTGLG